MNIAYFPKQVALNGAPVLTAFLNSCRSKGITPVENSMNADVAVIWSVLWNGRMINNKQVYDHYRLHDKPVIIIDIGSLRRGYTWKLAVNNITSFGYYGHTKHLNTDRPRLLGIELGNASNTNPAVLIAAQHSKSLQVGTLESMEQWVTEQVNLVKQYTDRPIVVRSHPRSKLNLPGTEIPVQIPGTYDSFDFNTNYHAVINYNSGPGIQAAIAGVRPIVDVSSLAWPVSVPMHDIEKLYDVDRDQWLIEICHTEYTLEEIEQGKWIQRINKVL